ncbi:MAG: hypothetical protein M9894_10225 [Planctomycetes bacterium]|nr:hypothetical protein [Planctomycetota bacterium]
MRPACPGSIDELHPQSPAAQAALAEYEAHARACDVCAADLERARVIDRALADLVGEAESADDPCPEPEELLAWLAGDVDDPVRVEHHLVACESCRTDLLLAARVRASGPSASSSSRRSATAGPTIRDRSTSSRRLSVGSSGSRSVREAGSSESSRSRRAVGAKEGSNSGREVAGSSESSRSRRAVGAKEGSSSGREATGSSESSRSRRAVGAKEGSSSGREAAGSSESSRSRRAVGGPSRSSSSRRALARANEGSDARRRLASGRSSRRAPVVLAGQRGAFLSSWPRRLAAAAVLALVAAIGASIVHGPRPEPARAHRDPRPREALSAPGAPQPQRPAPPTRTGPVVAAGEGDAWLDRWLTSIDDFLGEGPATEPERPQPRPPTTPFEPVHPLTAPEPDDVFEPDDDPPEVAAPPPPPRSPDRPATPTMAFAAARGVRVRLPDEGAWRRLDGGAVPAGATLRASSRGGVVSLASLGLAPSAIYLGPDARLGLGEDGATLEVVSGPLFYEGEDEVVFTHALGRVKASGRALLAARRGALALASLGGRLRFEAVDGDQGAFDLAPGRQAVATSRGIGGARPIVTSDGGDLLPDWLTSLRGDSLPPVTLPGGSEGQDGAGAVVPGGAPPPAPGRGGPGADGPGRAPAGAGGVAGGNAGQGQGNAGGNPGQGNAGGSPGQGNTGGNPGQGNAGGNPGQGNAGGNPGQGGSPGQGNAGGNAGQGQGNAGGNAGQGNAGGNAGQGRGNAGGAGQGGNTPRGGAGAGGVPGPAPR